MVGNILAVGLMSLGMGMSGVKDEPQMYAQNESTYTITYESEADWKGKAQGVMSFLQDKSYNASSKLTITGNITYTLGGNETTVNITNIYAVSSSKIMIDTADSNVVDYLMTYEYWQKNSNDSITLNGLNIVSQTYYEALAEPEPNMGSDIVGTIASGLGIIGALASNFLVGFGALFYAEGALTPFAIFALVMLGVAVSFAVVKLVLNLIRSNTGA